MRTKENIEQQIDVLLAQIPELRKSWRQAGHEGAFQEQVERETFCVRLISLIHYIYKKDDPLYERIMRMIPYISGDTLDTIKGFLEGIKENVQRGLIEQITESIIVDIQTDFLDSARRLFKEKHIESSAVLACSILEDTLKRLAEKHGLDELRNNEMGVVVSKLLSKKIIEKSTVSTIMSFKPLRNAALHAQWAEVSEETLLMLLTFLPVFIEKHRI